jgi:hypothetical protein
MLYSDFQLVKMRIHRAEIILLNTVHLLQVIAQTSELLQSGDPLSDESESSLPKIAQLFREYEERLSRLKLTH